MDVKGDHNDFTVPELVDWQVVKVSVGRKQEVRIYLIVLID